VVNLPRRRIDVTNCIYDVLKKYPKGATWTELLRDSGLSKGALSKHLNACVDVKRTVDREVRPTRPPSVVYKLNRRAYTFEQDVDMTRSASDDTVHGLLAIISTPTFTSFMDAVFERIRTFLQRDEFLQRHAHMVIVPQPTRSPRTSSRSTSNMRIDYQRRISLRDYLNVGDQTDLPNLNDVQLVVSLYAFEKNMFNIVYQAGVAPGLFILPVADKYHVGQQLDRLRALWTSEELRERSSGRIAPTLLLHLWMTWLDHHNVWEHSSE
jgi:hypothetical protein